MKMAMKDGQILIREADNVQFTIIKSWGKMKWSRQTQTLSGPADIELLNRLAGLVNLPPSIEAERKKLNEVMAAVDRERMNPKPEPLIPPPVKVSPFTHQVRGYNMALMTFGLVDPPKPKGGGEVIHIKETEIIPLLKEAQTEYSQKINEGDPKDVEMAERIEEALTQAMDIVYDYQSMADEHKRMVEKYETEAPVIKRGMDFYCCPACGKRTSRNHTHCHWCGKKLGWGR